MVPMMPLLVPMTSPAGASAARNPRRDHMAVMFLLLGCRVKCLAEENDGIVPPNGPDAVCEHHRSIHGTIFGMDLNELLVFTRVAQAGSFTAAARLLAMPKSTVSRKVSELEERVGSRLLQRT